MSGISYQLDRDSGIGTTWAELVAEKLQPELVDWNDYPDWKWPTNCRNGHSNNSPPRYLYRPLPPRGMSQPIVLMRYDNNGGKLFKVGHNGQNQCPIPRQSTDCNSIKGSTANNVYNWQPGTTLCSTYSLHPSTLPLCNRYWERVHSSGN